MVTPQRSIRALLSITQDKSFGAGWNQTACNSSGCDRWNEEKSALFGNPNTLKSSYYVFFSHLEKQIKTLLRGEIQRNCDFALLAHRDMIRCIESMKPDEKEVLDRFWLSVESFLISVANISKILWPSSQCGIEVSSRREALRTLLSVDDGSPIREKEFRNHFEHYDSRIEDWAKDYENKTIYDSNIGPIDSVIIGANDTLYYMRNFDPYKFTLHIRGEEYDINQVMTAVKELLAKTKAVQL